MFVVVVVYLTQQPPVGHGLLIHEISRSHTTTHHSQWDSSGRVISSSQRPLPDNTQHSQQISMPQVGFEFHENPSSESRVVLCGQQSEGRTDGHDTFRNFENAPNELCIVTRHSSCPSSNSAGCRLWQHSSFPIPTSNGNLWYF